MRFEPQLLPIAIIVGAAFNAMLVRFEVVRDQRSPSSVTGRGFHFVAVFQALSPFGCIIYGHVMFLSSGVGLTRTKVKSYPKGFRRQEKKKQINSK